LDITQEESRDLAGLLDAESPGQLAKTALTGIKKKTSK